VKLKEFYFKKNAELVVLISISFVAVKKWCIYNDDPYHKPDVEGQCNWVL